MRQPELKIKRARGFLLIVAILLLVVVAVAVAALGNMTSADVRSSSGHAQSEQAYFAATSGIEYAAHQFKTGAGTNDAACTAITNAAPVAVGSASFTLTGTYFNPANTSISIVGGITATDTVIPTPANGTLNFASHGRILIDGEQIVYRGKTSASFTGLRRGYAGTTATTHANAAAISQNQCVVRATGVSGTATRIVESALQPGPWSAFLDGVSTSILSASSTELGRIATAFPQGDNLIVAAVTMQNTTAPATTIAAGNLRLVRNFASANTTLDSNAFPVLAGTNTISATDRPHKSFFFVFRDANRATGDTYSVGVQGDNTNTFGEVKMLIINNAPRSLDAAGGIVDPISKSAAGTFVPIAPGFPKGDNLVLAFVHVDATNPGAAGDDDIAAGQLQLYRTSAPAGTLSSNMYTNYYRRDGTTTTNQEYSALLVALDSDAASAAAYEIRGRSTSAKLRGNSRILVIQGVGAAFQSGTDKNLAAGANTLTTLATAFPALAAGGSNLVIAPAQYSNQVDAATRNVNAGTEAIVYNGINRATNEFQYSLCTLDFNQCKHFPSAELWNQTAAPGSPNFSVVATPSSGATIHGESDILAIHLNPIADRVEIFP
jgi:Tfp pilus assembly protein PilX